MGWLMKLVVVQVFDHSSTFAWRNNDNLDNRDRRNHLKTLYVEITWMKETLLETLDVDFVWIDLEVWDCFHLHHRVL